MLLSLIFFLGVLVTNFLGRKIFNIGERIVKKVPVVNTIYSTLKQITETFTKATSDTFQGAVYIQYPRQGLWTMAFISGESKTKDGIIDVHDLHLWTLEGSKHILSLHAVVHDEADPKQLIDIKKYVRTHLNQFGDIHATIEFEWSSEDCSDKSLSY